MIERTVAGCLSGQQTNRWRASCKAAYDPKSATHAFNGLARKRTERGFWLHRAKLWPAVHLSQSLPADS